MKIVKFPQCYIHQLSRSFTLSWYDESYTASIGMAAVTVVYPPKENKLRPDDRDITSHEAVREQVRKEHITKLNNSLYY